MHTQTDPSPIPHSPHSPRLFGGIPAVGMAAAALALLGLACGDDTGGSGGGGDGGSGTTTTTTSGTGGGATTTTSSAGGGGEGGATGAGGAGEGGQGGAASAIECELFQGTEYCSTDCASFPQTLTMGPSISIDTTGAVLCQTESTSTCYLTSNTYSNGPNGCATDRLFNLLHFSNSGSYVVRTRSEFHIKSTSHGTINSEYPNELTGVPGATDLTIVVNDGTQASPGPNDYEGKLRFDGNEVTFSSLTKL